jgi:hypothetical protein
VIRLAPSRPRAPTAVTTISTHAVQNPRSGVGATTTTRRGYTILGWLVWQVGSRIVKRKVGQTMAENRVKLGLGGAVLLVVGAGLAALAARYGGDRSGDDE